jgi:hypothetical protein
MSRTRKGSKSPGCDFGSRYRYNRCYGAGTGPFPKKMAAKERRADSRRLVYIEAQT